MSDVRFHGETFGKWILAGEHAVLRGVPALVFPVKNYSMKFDYDPTVGGEFRAEFVGEHGAELQLIFWGLIENALQKLEKHRSDFVGFLKIDNSLPLGAGLGASAALCVGITKVFESLGWIKNPDVYEFSRQLENLFHGESSGVDIAIALAGQGLRFQRGGERTALLPNWSPRLYLSYSGKRGVTAECVKKVNELRAQNPQIGEKIDQQMRDAVELAEKALLGDAATGFDQLAHALDLGRDCFYQWGLCEGPLDQHLRELSRQGAYAIKPTGSGGGGYVLSLWRDRPPADLQTKLLPLFQI